MEAHVTALKKIKKKKKNASIKYVLDTESFSGPLI